jgi:hypothetical protein
MAVKKKDTRITLPITSAQKERWERYADEKDISLSSFIRNCVEAYISACEKIKKFEEKG